MTISDSLALFLVRNDDISSIMILLVLIDQEAVLDHNLCQVHESLQLQVLSSLCVSLCHGCTYIAEEKNGNGCDNQVEDTSVHQIHVVKDANQ